QHCCSTAHFRNAREMDRARNPGLFSDFGSLHPSYGRKLGDTSMANAAHAEPHHDYPLVAPSPWPIVGSISLFVTAVGAIGWTHPLASAAPLTFCVAGGWAL